MKAKNPDMYKIIIVAIVAFIGIILMVSIGFKKENTDSKNLFGEAVESRQTGQEEITTPNVKMTYTKPDAGIYDEPLEVELFSQTEGAQIRYTLDGSNPTEQSNLYTRPIKVYKDTDIKVKAYKNGYEPSTTMLARFFIR